MLILLYRIAFPILLLVTAPYYGYRMRRRGGYGTDFSHRFGNYPDLPPPPPGTTRIWVQAVSVGEVLALEPLLKRLRDEQNVEIVLTTTTSTGYAEVRKRYQAWCRFTGCFPLDWWPFSRKAWDRLKPSLAVTMESELWPEHIHQAQARGIPTVVLNARLSDRSFQRYLRFAPLARRLFAKLRHLGASSENDGERLRALGVPPEKVTVTGNLKCDNLPSPTLSQDERAEARARLGLGNANTLLLIGSSTWPGEEALLWQIAGSARTAGHDVRLLIVPRHAERRRELRRWLESTGVPFALRSENDRAAPVDEEILIYLADTTGELPFFLELGDIAFIGKSTAPHLGGQTPLESVALGLPSVYGPHMENFRTLVQSQLESNAAIRANDAEEVTSTLERLITDPAERSALRRQALLWAEGQKGSAERSMIILKRWFVAESAGR